MDVPPGAVAEDRPRTRWRGAIAWIVLGLLLRLAWAWRLGADLSGWEADGFVLAWSGPAWDATARVHPPLWSLVFGWMGAASSSTLGLRLASVGLSLLALLCVLDLAAQLSRRLASTRRCMRSATAWVAGVWALSPTLLAVSARPSGELLMGMALCEAFACLLRLAQGGGLSRWVLATLAVALAVLAGGVLLALVLLAGALVFLLPIPRLADAARFAGPVVVGVLLAGLAWRGPDPARLPLPDTHGLHGLAALSGSAPAPAANPSRDPDRRARDLVQRVGTGLRERGVWGMATAWAERLILELLAPARFQQTGWPTLPLGLLDVLLRGGVLLFALAVARMAAPRTPSAWPRAGCVAGAWVLLLLLVVAAPGPMALAPLDMLLLSVAGAGVARRDPAGGAVRRRSFLVGGLLLTTPALVAALVDRPIDPWLLRHDRSRRDPPGGALLAGDLAPPGPVSAEEHVRASRGFMTSWLPTLRVPARALHHARRALELQPESARALDNYIVALVDSRRMEEALDLAEERVRQPSASSSNARVLLQWVRTERNRARQEVLR